MKKDKIIEQINEAIVNKKLDYSFVKLSLLLNLICEYNNTLSDLQYDNMEYFDTIFQNVKPSDLIKILKYSDIDIDINYDNNYYFKVKSNSDGKLFLTIIPKELYKHILKNNESYILYELISNDEIWNDFITYYNHFPADKTKILNNIRNSIDK